jgi:arylsulfatase A-like enzyme
MRSATSWLLTALLAMFACLISSPSLKAAEPTGPNIIMVFIDDMGWGDFSCFGNRDAQTPNVDRLASEGLRFSQFYVNAPICSPSRCALTTGQYPHRWKINSYLNNRADNARRGVADWLDPQAPTLARLLQQHGYATGHFGKWHLGGQRDVDDAPPIRAYGFEQSLTNFEGMGPKLLPLTLKSGDTEPGRIWADAERLGQPVTWMQRSQITGGFVDAAIPFIDHASQAGKPFYVNLWPDDVHGPLWPPVEKWAEGKRGLYLSVLQEMDRQLGKLFDHVRNTPKLRDNTLILVCSDNGPEPGAGGAGPFRGAKTRLYEGGIRSPLVVWGPGLMPKEKCGTHNATSVFAAFDLVPSLLALAGVKAPPEVTFDGEDLSATLIGRSDASRTAPIHWRRPPDRKNSPPALPDPQPDLAVRDGHWKLLCNYDGTQPELYDLSHDIGETTNLAEQQPDVAKRLSGAAVAGHQSMPADNGPLIGAQATKPNRAGPKPKAAAPADPRAARPNVLLILVDDLKPTLGCYGDSIAKTPNIDRLAARSMRFDLAYCNQAVCAPSRFTLMLGSHSTSTGLYGLSSRLRDRIPDAVTLPHHFARHGYRTESLGKVFHVGHGNDGDPQSFSVAHFSDKVIEYADPASTDGGQLTREEAYFSNQQLNRIKELPRGAAFESPDVADEAYADGRVAAETIQRLQAARQRRDSEGTPFFIAVGFARPHLPFSSPQRYWDLYDPEQFAAPATEKTPEGAPKVAGKTNGELANYKPVPNSGEVDAALRTQLTHGYYASVSFVDAQIGKVLDELDRQQLTDNTIVVLWGDHGFHLGDHGYWTKHTNYEQANRIPLLIAAPGVAKPGSSTRQLAESADVFPTLAELAGLDAPTGPQRIDGRSLVPVLRDSSARVRDHAYHVFPKAKLGRAIRTERYRLVEWKNVGQAPETAELELYDSETDPHETRNVAAGQPQIVAELRAILDAYPEPVNPNEKANAKPAGAVPRAVGLSLSSPIDFQVVQRSSAKQGQLTIAGELAEEVVATDLKIEARFVDGQQDAPWMPVTGSVSGRTLAGTIEAPAGGWWRLEVRVTAAGNPLASSSVEHVGIGEVFVIAGQSNSANHGEERQRPHSGRVAAFDGKKWQIADDPQPGASGGGGSFIPPFADAIVAQENVPVGIVACGIGATSVREWLPEGATFPNPPTIESRVRKLPDGLWASDGAAFDAFVARMKPLGPRGFRAVLWHQGESDANQKDSTRTLPGPLYREYLEKVIRDSRQAVGWEAPWFVAQASYHVPGDEGSEEIRAAQASLSRDGIALAGPDSDALKGDLRDSNGQGVHFSGKGLREHGARWAAKVLPWLEQQRARP